MKVFPGVGDYIDAELKGRDPADAARLRARAMEDDCLAELSDLVGQAYRHGPSPESAAILANMAGRVEALRVRLAVGNKIVETAARDLIPQPVATTPKKKV